MLGRAWSLNGTAPDQGPDSEVAEQRAWGAWYPSVEATLADHRNAPAHPTAPFAGSLQLTAPAAPAAAVLTLTILLAGHKQADSVGPAEAQAVHVVSINVTVDRPLDERVPVVVEEQLVGNHTLGFRLDGPNGTFAHDVWWPVARWAELPVVIDASHRWYDGQNTFRIDTRVPYAPWLGHDGADVLQMLASRLGIELNMTWRSDLDSYYVLAINGTAEHWEQIAGVKTGTSHSWMIFVDDRLADRAIDDVDPDAAEKLELRYLRCANTGRCTGPDGAGPS